MNGFWACFVLVSFSEITSTFTSLLLLMTYARLRSDVRSIVRFLEFDDVMISVEWQVLIHTYILLEIFIIENPQMLKLIVVCWTLHPLIWPQQCSCFQILSPVLADSKASLCFIWSLSNALEFPGYLPNPGFGSFGDMVFVYSLKNLKNHGTLNVLRAHFFRKAIFQFASVLERMFTPLKKKSACAKF